jgi:hypothetical protein
MKKVKWEFVNDSGNAITERLKVTGGWMYHVGFNQAQVSSSCFVPEPSTCSYCGVHNILVCCVCYEIKKMEF